MNSGDLLYNHDQIIKELRSVRRQGMEEVISMLEGSDFFSSRVDSTDQGEGSLANHCLWVLRLARETLEYARSIGKGAALDDDSLVIVSLLHRLPSVKIRQFVCADPSPEARTMAVLRKCGLDLHEFELKVLTSPEPVTGSVESKDPAALLGYILQSSRKNALDYAAGIPYSEVPLDRPLPKPMNITSHVFMDEEDHRLWWNVSLSDFESHDHPDLKDFTKVETTAILPLEIGAEPSGPECAVLCDESGVMGFLAGYTREDDGTMFMCSDRLCFGYSDIVLFMSRFPHYRPSYVLAQRYDGKWGVFSIKASGKKRPPVVDVVPLVRHEFRNRDAALRAIKTKAGYPARVRHHLFYNEVSIMDCFLA